jgi:hypothetical protein
MQYYYKAHPNFTLLDSVILLFFSKTVKKDIICKFYLQLCNPALCCSMY